VVTGGFHDAGGNLDELAENAMLAVGLEPTHYYYDSIVACSEAEGDFEVAAMEGASGRLRSTIAMTHSSLLASNPTQSRHLLKRGYPVFWCDVDTDIPPVSAKGTNGFYLWIHLESLLEDVDVPAVGMETPIEKLSAEKRYVTVVLTRSANQEWWWFAMAVGW
jgi:hypothetical protein